MLRSILAAVFVVLGGAAPLEQASPAVREIVAWTLASHDSRGLPFAVVDKVGARVFVFGADGVLRGTAPVLLGMARGDDSVPGIGERPLASIAPAERTTPAGRFAASLDHNLAGHQILWVDYDAAISMHAVVTAKPAERRLARLATPSADDNRISYGCINVPAAFFAEVVVPVFSPGNGVVYVLPEVRSIEQVFGISPVDRALASNL